MILVVSGTKEAREIVSKCKASNWLVLALAVTKYGKGLTQSEGADCLLVEQLSENMLKQVLIDHQIKVVVDASHPFAGNSTKLLEGVCRQLKVNYIKFERKETSLPTNQLIHWVDSMEQACEKSISLGKIIFLTTGSHQLECFISNERMKKNRVIVRVLPEHSIIKKCQDMGISPKDIIAAQGPFSIKFNKEMFKFYKADVVVTKESGVASGTDTKVAAALAMGAPVVVVRRQKNKGNNCVYTYEDVISFIKRTLEK